MNARFPVLAILVMGSVLSGHPSDTYAQSGSPSSSQTVPRFEPAPCPFPLGVGQIDGRTIICGFVTVPEDRHRAGGSSIRLAVAVFKARTAARAVPLIVLGGGPGTNVLERFVPFFAGPFGRDLTDGRDLILFDQRGVGFSQPSLDCHELTDLKYQTLGLHVSRTEETNGIVEASLRCRDRLVRAGIDLAAYTTAASAADVDDIRRALGHAGIDVWGISYGTRLALTVVETYPTSVRSAVLDSAMPPQVTHIVEVLGNIERAFHVLFSACAADRACSAAYPNLEAAFYQLVAELNVTPLRYQAQHPRTGAIHTIVLTGDGLVNTLFEALHHTDLIPYLPLAAASLHRGDTTLLALAADRLVFDDGHSLGLHYSVQCAEEANLTNPMQVAAARRPIRSEIGDVFTQETYFRTCVAWGAARLSPRIKTPVVSAIPTLILAGQYDPTTPPDFGVMAGRTLRNSFVFEFPGVGHFVGGGSPCAQAVMRQFLENPTMRPDAGCIAQMGPPRWIIPGAR